MRDEYSITELCDALEVSRSGYHAARKRLPSARCLANRKLVEAIAEIHAHRHTRCYGSPRMTSELRSLGLSCSENRVARLMRTEGLRARPRKPFKPKTTRPDHAARPSPNLLASAPPPAAPGTQMVSDITYIPTHEGWLYLVLVIDLFSRAVLGWKIADSMHAELVTTAIGQAIHSGLVAPGAIFHSDRGCQYTARPTQQLLARHGLLQSMSAAGYCYDNAFAESAFATPKAELPGAHAPFQTKEAARLAIFDYLETFYNRSRRHSSLGMNSPHAFLSQYFQSQPTPLN
jgi:transposase InsO family protein